MIVLIAVTTITANGYFNEQPRKSLKHKKLRIQHLLQGNPNAMARLDSDQ
jgi:hypothetical protein